MGPLTKIFVDGYGTVDASPLPFDVLLFKRKRFYLSERERECTGRGEQQAEGEAGSPVSRDPDAGRDSRTLGP